MPLTILDTVFDVVFKFPTCIKCFGKLPLNITFNAAFRILTDTQLVQTHFEKIQTHFDQVK